MIPKLSSESLKMEVLVVMASQVFLPLLSVFKEPHFLNCACSFLSRHQWIILLICISPLIVQTLNDLTIIATVTKASNTSAGIPGLTYLFCVISVG